MMPMIEIWKDIQGHEGRYQVSNMGRVRSLPRVVNNHTGELLVKGKILSQRSDFKGYMRIDLIDNNGKKHYYGVHRLVAMAFIDNPDNKPQINHIDGKKDNNTVDNLEWVTNQENHDHAILNGLYPNQGKLRKHRKEQIANGNNKKGIPGRKPRIVLQINPITKEVIAEHLSIADAAKSVGCRTPSNISGCCRNERGRKTVKGYEWRYREEVVL